MRFATVGVIGLGTMGAGIAQVCAHAGSRVVACDARPEAVAAGRERIAAGYARHVERGRMTAAERDAALDRLATGTGPADVAGCQLVIEAVVEDLDVKRAVFAELEAVCAKDAVLATNTSALSVTEIASATGSPGRVLGMHFFNPAPVLPLVEVVATDDTDPAVTAAVRDYAVELGKQPVVCPDRPGFVVNRILIPLLNDCVRLYEQGGIAPEDLDRALTAGLNWPIGPLALIDLIGADVHVHAAEAMFAAYREPRFAPPPTLVRMARSGRLGRKSGRGFHRYP